GRSDRQNWTGGICVPAPGRAWPPRPGREQSRPGRRRLTCRGERQHHSLVDPQLIVSRAGLRKGTKSSARRELCRHLARFARKTGRRLTSDPIRTSLGLLPSGPDPVGEWLVHRQSPGPYLGPKGPESKRGWVGTCAGTTPVSSWPGLTRRSTSCFFRRAQKKRECPGHLARKRA